MSKITNDGLTESDHMATVGVEGLKTFNHIQNETTYSSTRQGQSCYYSSINWNAV